MLDVHPPHAPVHTWRDFLIHMSAIWLGLLLAISLEQTVEYAWARQHPELKTLSQHDVDEARAHAGLPPEQGPATFNNYTTPHS